MPKKALIHDHIDHCLGLSLRAPDPKGKAAALRELRTITKYL
jgi:metal-dependent hydrolase (beta-lactamase superfamily II)